MPNGDVDEIMKESEKENGNLPEAPASTHIDSYYKGFHVGFTIRSEDNKTIPSASVKRVINSLIEEGYKPSWNEETNDKHEGVVENIPLCPVCSGEMVKRSGAKGEFWGCSKYPNCRGTRPIEKAK